MRSLVISSFFFNDTATTEIYTLSLHDALPISFPRRRPCAGNRCRGAELPRDAQQQRRFRPPPDRLPPLRDRKSTRLNSSHLVISYAVFCLKKNRLFTQPRVKCLEHILASSVFD